MNGAVEASPAMTRLDATIGSSSRNQVFSLLMSSRVVVSQPLFARLRLLLSMTVFWLLQVGCATSNETVVELRPATPQSLAGFWEVDYSRSDNLNEQLSSIARRVQREAARRARAAEDGRPFIASALPNSNELVTLARLTEVITEPTLLEIYQDNSQVRIKRDNSFALNCAVLPGATGFSQTLDVVGAQRCGWDADQLLFELQLFEGLKVSHRFSISQSNDALLMTTIVKTTSSAYPFRVNQYFTRYDPADLGYRCERTLSRGTVCTTRKESP